MIATQAAGSRQQSRFLAMMNDYSRLSELQAAAMDSAGSSAEQFDKTLESLESKLQNLNNAWTEFTMGIANNEIIKGIVDILQSIISGVNTLLDKLDGLPKILASIGVIILGFNIAKLFVTTVILPIATIIKEESIKISQDVKTQMQEAGGNAGKAFAVGFKTQLTSNLKSGKNFLNNYFETAAPKDGGFLKQFLYTNKIIKELSRSDVISKIYNRNQDTLDHFGITPQIMESLTDSKLSVVLKSKLPEKEFEKFNLLLNSTHKELEVAIPSFGKLGKSLSSIGMLLNMLTPAITGLMKATGASDEEIEKATKTLTTAGTVITTVGMLLPILSKGIQGLSTSLTKSTLGIKIFGAEAVATGTAVSAAFWWITAIVAAVALVIWGCVGAWKAWDALSPEGKIKAAQETLSKLNEELETTNENIDTLTDGIDKFRDLKEELDDLTKGSTEWNNKILEINDNILDIAEVGNLWGDITVDENGMLSISEDAQLKAIQEQQNNKIDLQNDILQQQLIVAQQELEIAKREESKTKKGTEENNRAKAEVATKQASVDQQTLNIVKVFTKDKWTSDTEEVKSLRQLVYAEKYTELQSQNLEYVGIGNSKIKVLEDILGTEDYNKWNKEFKRSFWGVMFQSIGDKEYEEYIDNKYNSLLSDDKFFSYFSSQIDKMSIGDLKLLYNTSSLTKAEAGNISSETKEEAQDIINKSLSNTAIYQEWIKKLIEQYQITEEQAQDIVTRQLGNTMDIWSILTNEIAFKNNIDSSKLTSVAEKFSENISLTTVEAIAEGLSKGTSEDFYNRIARSGLSEDLQIALAEADSTSYYSMLKVIDSFTELSEEERQIALKTIDVADAIYDVPFSYVENKLNRFTDAIKSLADALDSGTYVFDEETKSKLVSSGADASMFVLTPDGYVYIGDINELDRKIKGKYINEAETYNDLSNIGNYDVALNKLFKVKDDNPLFTDGVMSDDNQNIWNQLVALASESGQLTQDEFQKRLEIIFGKTNNKQNPTKLGGYNFSGYSGAGFAQVIAGLQNSINSYAPATKEQIEEQQQLADSYKDISLLLGQIDEKDEESIDTLIALARQYGVAEAEVQALIAAGKDLTKVENQKMAAIIANEVAIAKWTKTNEKRIKSLKELYDTTQDVSKLEGSNKNNFMQKIGLDFTKENDNQFFNDNISLLNAIFANDENSQAAFEEFQKKYQAYLYDTYEETTIVAQKMVESGLFYIGQGAQKAGSIVVNTADETCQTIKEATKQLTDESSKYVSQVLGIDLSSFLGQTSPSSSSNKDDWENKFDKLYNLLEKINDTIRSRDKLNRQYNYMLKSDREAYTIDKMKSYSTSDLAAQKQTIKDYNNALLEQYKQLYNGRKSEMSSSLKDANYKNKYYTYDSATNSISINWDKINKISDSDLGQKIEEEINEIEKIRDNIDSAEDNYNSQVDTIVQVYEEARDATMELEDRVYNALVEQQQRQIDELSTINDTIADQNSKLINKMQKAISNSRQERENKKTEQEIADKQARLTYLQMDTTGSNQQEILSLQKELDDARQDYTDNLIDQKISELEDQNDVAQEQRERQIQIMQAQLNYNKETGAYWSEVSDLLMVQNGKIVNESKLTELLTTNENFAGLSDLKKGEWLNNLKNALSLTIYYNTEKEQFESGITGNGTALDLINGTANGDEIKGEDTKGTDKTKNNSTEPDYSPKKKLDTSIINTEPFKKYQISPVEDDYETFGGFENMGYTSIIDGGSKGYGSYSTWSAEPIKLPGNDTEFLAFQDSKGNLWFVKKSQADITTTPGYLHIANGVKVHSNDWLRYDAGLQVYAAYATGGLNTSTGPAWLDGTYSKPELVLNAQDTQNFIALKDILSHLMKGNMDSSSVTSNVDVDIDINVNELANDYDVEKLVNKVKSEISKASNYRNNTVVSLK